MSSINIITQNEFILNKYKKILYKMKINSLKIIFIEITDEKIFIKLNKIH